jgi:hypothetical protein
MGGVNRASLRIHVCIVGRLYRCYPDRNLGLHAIRPINKTKGSFDFRLLQTAQGRDRYSARTRRVMLLRDAGFRALSTPICQLRQLPLLAPF